MNQPSMELARNLLEKREDHRCFSILKECWLSDPGNIEAAALMSQLMALSGKHELAEALKRLSASPDSWRTDAQNLFEAGFQFIDQHECDLAAMLLKLCVELLPNEPTVNYELGFALMSLKRYQEAIVYFQKCLAREDDFETRLNLAVAYTCTRQIKMVKEMITGLAKLAVSDEEKEELAHQRIVSKRLEAINNRKSFTARDWLYVHYGSVLIAESKNADGRFGQILNDYQSIAKTLITLRGVLEGLGAKFDCIEFYSSLSRPLAQAMADLTGLPCELYKGKRDDRALLIMSWASDIIGPHESFIDCEPERSIFAYGLTWHEPLPVVPEIVGNLSEASAMPWSQRWRVEQWDDGRAPTIEEILEEPQGAAEARVKILDQISLLEADPEVLHDVQLILDCYGTLSDYLVLGNTRAFKRRPEYTNEIPI